MHTYIVFCEDLEASDVSWKVEIEADSIGEAKSRVQAGLRQGEMVYMTTKRSIALLQGLDQQEDTIASPFNPDKGSLSPDHKASFTVKQWKEIARVMRIIGRPSGSYPMIADDVLYMIEKRERTNPDQQEMLTIQFPNEEEYNIVAGVQAFIARSFPYTEDAGVGSINDDEQSSEPKESPWKR